VQSVVNEASLSDSYFYAFFVLLAVDYASRLRLPALQIERKELNRRDRKERMNQRQNSGG
jgi:hypothetical protein